MGWLIWAIVSLLLVGPCIYAIYLMTYDTANTLTRIVAGIFCAAILSGFITWIGNEIWFRIKRKKHETRRKAVRKGKRSRNNK